MKLMRTHHEKYYPSVYKFKKLNPTKHPKQSISKKIKFAMVGKCLSDPLDACLDRYCSIFLPIKIG